METALLLFVFYVATVLIAEVVQNLRQNPLQRVVGYCPALRAGRVCHRFVAVVADVKRSGVLVTGVLLCVEIVLAEFLHILLRSQNTRDYNFMERDSLYLKGVKEHTANVL